MLCVWSINNSIAPEVIFFLEQFVCVCVHAQGTDFSILKFYLFMFFVLGLHCCKWVFSSCSSWTLEHGLSSCGTWA